jgi:hypothetical protein
MTLPTNGKALDYISEALSSEAIAFHYISSLAINY